VAKRVYAVRRAQSALRVSAKPKNYAGNNSARALARAPGISSDESSGHFHNIERKRTSYVQANNSPGMSFMGCRSEWRVIRQLAIARGKDRCYAGTRESTRAPLARSLLSRPSPSPLRGCIWSAACRYARIAPSEAAHRAECSSFSRYGPRHFRVNEIRAAPPVRRLHSRDNIVGEGGGGGELSPRFALFIMLREFSSTPVLPPRIAAPRRGLLITAGGGIDNN
jgi:hypothetical protein